MALSRSVLALALAALSGLCPVVPFAAADDCQPSTWAAQDDIHVLGAATSPPGPKITRHAESKNPKNVGPGDVNCRFWVPTGEDVNYYTCTELAEKYEITVEKFFELNPDVKDDCSNLKPNTEYCLDGFIQPIVNDDGTCGPKHGNGTCGTTSKPCCNAQTWMCGDQVEDCTDGICYQGACPGHKTYTTDGTCGYQNGDRLCAGIWGDCCNFDGECGTGADYCGKDKCQSGNCTVPIGPSSPSRMVVAKHTED